VRSGRRVGRVDVRRADDAFRGAAAERGTFHGTQIKAHRRKKRQGTRLHGEIAASRGSVLDDPGVTDPHRATPLGKPRARALGIPLAGRPGPCNAITDVPGVTVGYATLIEGTDVRTGVTAILPRPDPGDPCAAGFHSLNGNGEMTGLAWIGETGTQSSPICLTNTHAVGVAHAGIVRWTVRHHPRVAEAWLLPVVSETWDGYLNDINGAHVTEDSVLESLDAAASGPLEEGSVGGGTGMCCYEFKGGTGTASRIVGDHVVGVLVQANFGSRRELTLAGVGLGEALAGDNPLADWRPAGGSIVAIVATDAPLLPHQCAALARRVTLGVARTGTTGSHFSGDLFLALSTGNERAFAPRKDSRRVLRFVGWHALDPYFEAVVQATEEAVLNALVANDEMTGFRGHRVPALPRERVRAAMP
jgi:L-aminopeptidase/D-esterase-like protein